MTFVWYAGLLDLALTAAQLHHAAAFAKALFLLRNLALAAENKVHFVTNLRALPVLLAAAARAGHNAEAGAYAASALWALMHQGEKASPLAPVCMLSINQSNKFIHAPVMDCHRLVDSAWKFFIVTAVPCTKSAIANLMRCMTGLQFRPGTMSIHMVLRCLHRQRCSQDGELTTLTA